MKIIISPAKKMNSENDWILPNQKPLFLKKTERIMSYIKQLSLVDLKRLLSCNDEIAILNYERFKVMDLNNNLSPAILSYDGIQYKYMAPQVFESEYFNYIEDNLRIVSGFYGILKPFDGVTPYRLEMQAKLETEFCKNLYDFWGKDIFNAVTKDDNVILNLASKEYSKTVSKYLDDNIQMVNCVFGEIVNGKVVEKGVYVKMARGEMVRFLAENNIQEVNSVKYFDKLGYSYNQNLSTKDKYVFIKKSPDKNYK